MAERSKDWLKQAEKDLNAAESMSKAGHYEWACFVSQQSAEKTLKAIYQKYNGEARGHSVLELAKRLTRKIKMDKKIIECGRDLDKYYIPTRYPNGFETGSPYEYYTKDEADHAIICARKILELGQSILA